MHANIIKFISSTVGVICGILLEWKPSIPFKAYGDRESLLLIYPQYQRQGVGTRTLNLIHKYKKPTFFVSSTSNPASSAFFQKPSFLGLVSETDRYRVYSRY
jgi:GNAT superfamily N-acetyltransferase